MATLTAESAPSVVAASSATLAVGDKAQALWKMGRKYYSVRVREVNDDGTYALTYEDGDTWESVPADRIKTLAGEPLAVAAAVVPMLERGTRQRRHAVRQRR